MNLNLPNSISPKYKPACYWGWFDIIKPEEVKWQIRQMHDAGLGGYIMHARGGRRIPYMGKQWMASVKAMIEEGKSQNMLTWIDDEDGWPSGFGAGEVTGLGEAYWQKYLVKKEIPSENVTRDKYTLGIYALYGPDIVVINKDDSMPLDADKIIEIKYAVDPNYTDLMDEAVVKKFIKVSHERYHEEFKNEFGQGIAGIFTDEPQLRRGHSKGAIPWSLVLPKAFKQASGYDLISVLPAIYYKTNGYERVRYDFWKTVNKLFVEAYAKQISQWCNDHKCILTSHIVLEDSLATQIPTSGGVMPFYEYMQLPGIDWLGRGIGSHITPKQVSSACQQLGKKQVLSEMFGCSGWNVSFKELKWIAEWQYVLGINYMAQHLGLYSLRGSRKREYPASLFYQQPWWKEFTSFNEYFTRLSFILTQGEPVVDILVIHPLKSGWITYDGDMDGAIKDLDDEFSILTSNLLQTHYDFHYGDETIMAKYGEVKDGKLKVGEGSYEVVIIPPSVSLDKSTIKLMKQFLDVGGKVISVGPYPTLCEGSLSEDLKQLKDQVDHISHGKASLKNALRQNLSFQVEVLDETGKDAETIFYSCRMVDGKPMYYFVNTSLDDHVYAKIIMNNEGGIREYDVLDGVYKELSLTQKSSSDQAQAIVSLRFEPGQSRIIISGDSKEVECKSYYNNENDDSKDDNDETLQEVTVLKDSWNIDSVDRNALTLDYCNYAINGGTYDGEIPVIELQEKLISIGKPVDVKMKFVFEIEPQAYSHISDSLYLIIEDPKEYEGIIVNDRIIESTDCGWWIDKSFRKIQIGPYVEEGHNNIVLTRHFYCSERVYELKNKPRDLDSFHEAELNRLTVDTELESVYLLGNFSVKSKDSYVLKERRSTTTEGPFVIDKPVSSVKTGDFTNQGFPFFTGRIRMSQQIRLTEKDPDKQYFISMYDPDAPVVNLWVNNCLVKTLMWPPYLIDITKFLVKGDNSISFELVSSCRNLLGPHHHIGGELHHVGSFHYEKNEHWADSYSFVRFGLNGTVRLLEDFCS